MSELTAAARRAPSGLKQRAAARRAIGPPDTQGDGQGTRAVPGIGFARLRPARRGEADQATAEAKLAEARAKEQARHEREAARTRAPARRSTRETPIEAVTKSVLRTAGSTITRELLRGLLGGLRRR